MLDRARFRKENQRESIIPRAEGLVVSRPPSLPPPILDAEVHAALSYLERYPSGMTRHDLERLFGSDRRGRDVLAAVAERAIAAIVVVDSPLHGAKVYRIAANEDEVAAEERRLFAYETSARRRREGVRRAFVRGPQAPQASLF